MGVRAKQDNTSVRVSTRETNEEAKQIVSVLQGNGCDVPHLVDTFREPMTSVVCLQKRLDSLLENGLLKN